MSLDLFLAAGTAFGTLVSPDAACRYLDDGSDQGTAWYAAGFDDSDWVRGSMKLRYGAAGDKNVTTYFRHSFEVPDPSIYEALGLEIASDDGMVIYLNGTEIAATNMPCGSMTVAAWIKRKPSSRGWRAVISKGEAWDLLVTRNDRLGFEYVGVTGPGSHTGNAVVGNLTIEVSKWYHVTGVCDGTTMHLYVNGKLDASQRAFGIMTTNEYPVVIGGNWENSGHEFNGLIDDACIYSYALSPADVEALYLSQGPGPLEKPKWAVSAGL